MTIVTQGYGCGYLGTRESCFVSCPAPSANPSPNLNMELYIDGQRFQEWHIIQINWEIGALTTFQINFGDPNRNHRWIRQSSLAEVYLSWGDRDPVKYFSGYITRMSRNVSNQRYMVTASGVNHGLYMRDKQAWDNTYERLSYNNMKCSEILTDLIAQVDSIDGLVKPNSDEPSISLQCEQGSSILTNFIKVSQYGGYDWKIDEDGKLFVYKEPELVDGNAKFNLLLGDYNSFSDLPEHPHLYIRGVTLQKDYNTIKNFYKVVGANAIYGTGFNQFSIQKYGRTAEARYVDESLTSVQSCESVARRLAEVNGEPRITVPIKIKGNTYLDVGDIVYCDDLDRQVFTSLDNQYLKVYQKNDTISKSGWSSDVTIGAPKKEIYDVL